RLSPDGKYMTYASEESGNPEIYIQTFPISEKRWHVSSAGGVQPMWRSDGKELFYLALDGTLMAVDVKTSPEFDAGTPSALFQTNSQVLYCRSSYASTRDGQRLLVNSYIAGDTT